VKKHDHRQSIWAIASPGGGAVYWCYRCGALRVVRYLGDTPSRWHRPTGLAGENPAMKKFLKK